MKLSEFIRNRLDSIIAGRRRAAGMSPAVADHLARVLLAAADELDRPPAGKDEQRESHESSRKAAQRLGQDLPLDRLIAEYGALREGVTSSFSEHMATGGVDVHEIVGLGRALDESLAMAVASRPDSPADSDDHAELNSMLAESEKRFRALVNATSHSVYRLSQDGREMRELNGRGRVVDTRSPTTSWLDEYIFPDDQPMARERFIEARRNRTLLEFEHRYRRVDGRIGWTLTRAIPLMDDDGRIIEWFGTATDVTARRQAQEALREADRSKDEFLAILGHELRNPLAPLRTSVDLLEHARGKPELLDNLRLIMDRQLSHLVRLVDDLLDIARITRGQVTLQRAALDLNLPIEAAVEQAKPAVLARQHHLHVDLHPAPLLVSGDHVRLTQVVANLLSNAAKYMETGGRIDVSTALEHDKAVIRVRDTGYGIPPEGFERLFTLFSRLDQHSAQAGSSGLGVGLALSHQLIALHGGTLEAHSEGRGCGSEFIVRLALVGAQALPGAAPDRQDDRSAPWRVLIVDDDDDAASTLRMLLEVNGQDVQVVDTGLAALKQVERFSPHLVLLDLGLPDITGVEVARGIRARRGGGEVLLVAVTGWGQDHDRQQTAAAGFDEHLIKPVTAKDIERVLTLAAARTRSCTAGRSIATPPGHS